MTDNLPPFSPETRSSIRIKQSEKRLLADPSLACGLLALSPQGLIHDLNTFGFLFEAMCLRDLRIYANSFGAELYHYQDYRDNEIDAVIELPDKSWCAIEIKLGAHQIDSAAQGLLKINKKIEANGGIPASELCVICGLSMLHIRDRMGYCCANYRIEKLTPQNEQSPAGIELHGLHFAQKLRHSRLRQKVP